ncbi:MAG TPA: hypothetical protein VLA43_16280 [Longimicrobiales bacterium]|nr:hypothetical protein [Longimicrobiales bacterium]
MSSLLVRFRERRVVQWSLAYLAAAWLLLQVVSDLADPWGIPGVWIRALTVALALGFFVTLVLAWYHGEKGHQRVTGPELLILAGIAGVAAALLSLGGRPTAPISTNGDLDPSPPATSIAVLPFLDLSPDGSQQHFGDGVATEIIHRISRDGRLQISGRSSAFALRDRPAAEVGRALGVASILEGTVRTDGDRMRIQVSLVSAADGFERWSRQFDRSAESILQLQAEIANAVVAELTGTAMEETADQGILSPEAADLYFQARAHWTRRTRADLLRAMELFEQASAMAPGYARLASGLADTYAVLGFYQYLPPDEAFPAAVRYANHALSLDPQLPDAVAAIAYVDMYYHWDWSAAEEGFLRALNLDPGYAVAHQWYGNLLVILGRHPEALRQFRRAVELEPLSLITRAAQYWGLFYARDFQGALDGLDQVLTLDPSYELAHYWRGWTLQQLGRMDEAIRSLENAVALSDSSAITLAALAGGYGRADRVTDAKPLLDRLTDPTLTPNPPAYELGKAFLAAGDEDLGFRWLERAWAERANQLAFIGQDPELDPLRGDPRLASLIRRMRVD